MFIYHFSKLIKSKLLWGFLALLMVFAFVVMDSCSGPSAATTAGYIGEERVDAQAHSDASQSLHLLTETDASRLNPDAMVLGAVLALEVGDSSSVDAQENRLRATWSLLAARAVAEPYGIVGNDALAREVIRTSFTDASGYHGDQFQRVLSMLNYQNESMFIRTYANVFLPAQMIAGTINNAAAWVTPLEVDFVTSVICDTTKAYVVTMENTLLPEAYEPSEEALQAWYNDHSADYMTPEAREIAYVEVPMAQFEEGILIGEDNARDYYEAHLDDFPNPDTNVTDALPFEDVRAEIEARLRTQEASYLAPETLTEKLEALRAKQPDDLITREAFDAFVKDYGEVKTATVSQPIAIGFEKGTAVADEVFKLDAEFEPCTVVAGTSKVYIVFLTKITEEHLAPFDEVKARVQTAARKDALEKRLRENGATMRTLLQEELAKGTDLKAFVEAHKAEGLSLSDEQSFILNTTRTLSIPNATEVLQATAQLGVKEVSEPILVAGDNVLLVVVTERIPTDEFAKMARRADFSEQLRQIPGAQKVADWLRWNMARLPITRDLKNPIFLPKN